MISQSKLEWKNETQINHKIRLNMVYHAKLKSVKGNLFYLEHKINIKLNETNTRIRKHMRFIRICSAMYLNFFNNKHWFSRAMVPEPYFPIRKVILNCYRFILFGINAFEICIWFVSYEYFVLSYKNCIISHYWSLIL